jgi:excinuclease UvrABC nuclease subunit
MEAFDTNLLKGNYPSKKNSKFLSLQGDFLRNESTIQLSENQSLQILERKEYSQTKPRFFLVLKVDESENYVSSLYPSKKPSIFYADYLGSKYELDFSHQNKVKIRARGVH